MKRKLVAEGFLVVESRYSRNRDTVTGIKFDRVTARKPSLNNRQYAIKVKLSIPSTVFERLIPTVELTVGEDDVIEPDLVVLEAGE